MRNLSRWAKANPWKARILIVFAQILLAALAYFIGTKLSSLHFRLPALFCFVQAAIYVVTVLFYPSVRYSRFSGSPGYWSRKTADLLVAVSSFFLVCWVFNSLQELSAPVGARPAATESRPVAGSDSPGGARARAEARPAAEKILLSLQEGHRGKPGREERKVLKKEFRYQLKEYAKAQASGNLGVGFQVLLIIVAVAIALGILWVVAALACSLSCSGSGAAAAVVAILGVIGVIFGLTLAIKAITRGGKKAPAPAPAAG